MNFCVQVPVFLLSTLDIIYKYFVKISNSHFLNCLLNKTSCGCITTSNFKYVFKTFKHFGNKFITSKSKQHSSGVKFPGVILC